MTDEERSALRAGIQRARAVAAPVGPLHGLWDVIFDAEALLEGKPTQLSGPPDHVRAQCQAVFDGLGGGEAERLLALVARVDACSGWDARVNEAILVELGYRHEHGVVFDGLGQRRSRVPDFLDSVDDSALLVPAGWWLASLSMDPDVPVAGRWTVVLRDVTGSEVPGYGPTEALTRTSAALLARAVMARRKKGQVDVGR